MPELKSTFKWAYTPAHYFSQKIESEINGWMIEIHNGNAQAIVRSEGPVRADPTLRDDIYKEIERHFFAEQLLQHSSYNISYDRLEEETIEGRQHVIIEVETARLGLTTYPPKLLLIDENGNITYDSDAEYEEAKRILQKKILAASRIDPISVDLMNSYKAAVNNPASELVHLYEIRDALATHYGGAHKAQRYLGVDAEWSRLGILCNEEPLNQGRHKGRHVGALRNATDDELKEARSITLLLLESHFDFVIQKEANKASLKDANMKQS